MKILYFLYFVPKLIDVTWGGGGDKCPLYIFAT